IKFSGVAAGEACTVVLRGSTNQMVDETERSLHDALSVLSDSQGDPHRPWRWMFGDVDGRSRGREREESQREESDRGGSVYTRPASNPDDFGRQRRIRFVRISGKTQCRAL